MTVGALTKAALLAQKRAIADYRAFLPALDLKRRSLMVARIAQARAIESLRARLAGLAAEAADTLPMLAHAGVPVERLAAAPRLQLGEERVFGAALPRLEAITQAAVAAPRHVFPHWAEPAVRLAQTAAAVRLELRVALTRLEGLEAAVKKVTQRINLLEKVLIPEAEARIRAIEIQVAEVDRAAVVIAKLAKAKAAAGAPL